ncbi:MAG: HD domain-containing protein [Vicinamibacterales bacterium]
MIAGRPPRLLVKALGVSVLMVAVLLALVFVVVRASVRDQVRTAITRNLDVTQRMLAALEARRLHELRTQAVTLAENPTLKAALDTYAAERLDHTSEANLQPLLATLQHELDKLAARVDTDALAIASADGDTLALAGRLSDPWIQEKSDARLLHQQPSSEDSLVQSGSTLFRVIHVPLTLDDGATIGWLNLASALDARYTATLDGMSGLRTAVTNNGEIVATTLTPDQAHDLELLLRARTGESGAPGTEREALVTLGGASHAAREIARVDSARIFALSSIDDAAAAATARLNRVLALLAISAALLALAGSIWLARRLTQPIEVLSKAMDGMAADRTLATPLPVTGSSREIDLLTTTFNHLMTSVVDADARTEAAYASAIRALAAALDARDPYTAGHSERVSVFSVAIGRVMGLPDSELDVLRLGALLHDIGKIGIPDEILRKPGPLTDAEFEVIMEHPTVGARILRTIPFLHPHLDIVELHHERPDGLGYPKGLQGEEIPPLARIVHVADAYDAMTSARAYRPGRSSNDALRELWRCAGTEYHADIVAALARALPRLPVMPSEPQLAFTRVVRAEARRA